MRFAASSRSRCWVADWRAIASGPHSSPRVWPLRSRSRSSRTLRVGSARALNTASSSPTPTLCRHIPAYARRRRSAGRLPRRAGRGGVRRAAARRKPSLGARRLETDSALQRVCRIYRATSLGGKEKNRPMAATLQEILLGPGTQPKVIADCYALIDQEVSDKSGISGTAVKLAYKTVNAFMPGHIRHMVGKLLPDMVGQLEPFWADFNSSGGAEFGDYLAKRGQ